MKSHPAISGQGITVPYSTIFKGVADKSAIWCFSEMNPLEAIQTFPLQSDFAYVGFSGGADSTALLLAMSLCGWAVTAVHFNHHLRGQAADDDEAWCRQFCAARGIALEVIDLQVNDRRWSGESIEECARRLRLEAWQRFAQEGEQLIFLAHHADDCLEELFLRLGRGSNSSGLASLRPVREIGNLRLCRPFLKLRKRELEEWLRQQDVTDWRIDSTNLDASTSRRNAIRNQLLPLVREIFGTDAGLLASLDGLREDAVCLEHEADMRLKSAGSMPSLKFWQDLPPALLVRVIRKWAKMALPPSRMTFRRLGKAIAAGKSELVPVGTGQWIRVSQKGLTMAAGNVEPPSPLRWEWNRPPHAVDWQDDFRLQARIIQISNFEHTSGGEIFDGQVLPKVLTIRAMQPGDVMQPFGGEHHRKVADIFRDHHITPEERQSWPMVCAGENIIWIPGVCRAEFARVTENTPEMVFLTFEVHEIIN